MEKNSTEAWKKLMKSKMSPEGTQANLLKFYILTDKTYRSSFLLGQYTFDVDVKLTKPQIKKLVENFFNVNVVAVNTRILPRKKMRVGIVMGDKPRYKRAVVTLKKGQFINLNPNQSAYNVLSSTENTSTENKPVV